MRSVALVAIAALSCAAVARGQGMTAPRVVPESSPPPEVLEFPDLDSPEARAYAAAQKRRVELERELHKIRATYFRNVRNTEMRQAGIAKLREYTDPAVYPSLLKIFKRDKEDVRNAILDHLADQKSEQADATLAWAAVFDETETYRFEAAERLGHRAEEAPASFYVKSVVAKGLASPVNREVTAAAELAQHMNLLEAIPAMISAQVSGAAAQVGGTDESALAYILIGTQQAFVSDLTPVVGDSAVAFDPTVGVVTEGVVLRVLDAVVLTYRVEVHNALVGMTSRAWGQPTRRLGWDIPKWQEWYAKEFVPHLANLEAEKAAAQAQAADRR